MIEGNSMLILAHSPGVVGPTALVPILLFGPAWFIGIVGLLLSYSHSRRGQTAAFILAVFAIVLVIFSLLLAHGELGRMDWLNIGKFAPLPGVPVALAVITFYRFRKIERKNRWKPPKNRRQIDFHCQNEQPPE